MKNLAKRLNQVHTRTGRAISWRRAHGPFDVIDLQRRAREALGKNGALATRAAHLLDETLRLRSEQVNAQRRSENERDAVVYAAARRAVLRSRGALASVEGVLPQDSFRADLESVYGLVDSGVRAKGMAALARVKAIAPDELQGASEDDAFWLATGSDVAASHPASCRCVGIADVLADAVRRCEDPWTLEQAMITIIAWLIATDPSFDPEAVGLPGFRPWESDPRYGNEYDRRERIIERVGWSCSGLYLGGRFREQGTGGDRILTLAELLSTVAELSLAVLDARDPAEPAAAGVPTSIALEVPPRKEAERGGRAGQRPRRTVARKAAPDGWVYLNDAAERYDVPRSTLQDWVNKELANAREKDEASGQVRVNAAALEMLLEAKGRPPTHR